MVRLIIMLRGMRYGPVPSRKRHNDRGGPSRDTATSRERERSRQALRREPDDGSEVERDVNHGRRANGCEGTPLNRADAAGGGDHCCLPTAYPAAAGRLPLWTPAHHPAPHPIIAAPVHRTAWH